MFKLSKRALLQGLLISVFTLLPLGVGGLRGAEPQFSNDVKVEKTHFRFGVWVGPPSYYYYRPYYYYPYSYQYYYYPYRYY